MILIDEYGYCEFESIVQHIEYGQYTINDSTDDGKTMLKLYIDNYPFVEFEHDDKFITKVIVLEKPTTLVDIPLTEMEILQNRVNELESQLNVILG